MDLVDQQQQEEDVILKHQFGRRSHNRDPDVIEVKPLLFKYAKLGFHWAMWFFRMLWLILVAMLVFLIAVGVKVSAEQWINVIITGVLLWIRQIIDVYERLKGKRIVW
jgi:hypothetical protein